MPPFLGFIGVLLGLLLVAGALYRARVTPLWAPAAIVVAALAFFFVNGGGVVSALTMLPMLAACVAIAARLLPRSG